MRSAIVTLPDDPGTLKAILRAERARAERLEQIIKAFLACCLAV
jgi:transposase